MEYVVDVLMPVYNHEKYIDKAIEGILNQKTNFNYRLIIAEDCSKDNSRLIIEGFAKNNPDIIYPIYNKLNLGVSANCCQLFSAISAKYVAFCEGDDYWTDSFKLQKQFDFLESNQEFAMCFTDVEVLNEMGSTTDYPYSIFSKNIFEISDIIAANKVFIPTATLFFRNVFSFPIPDFIKNAISIDIAIHLLITDKGKAKHLPIKTAVYRQHLGGVTKSEEHITKGDDKLFQLYVEANNYFYYKYNKFFRQRLLEMSKIKLIYGSRNLTGFKKLKYVFKNCRNYFFYSDSLNFKEITYYFIVLFFPNLLKLKKHS